MDYSYSHCIDYYRFVSENSSAAVDGGVDDEDDGEGGEGADDVVALMHVSLYSRLLVYLLVTHLRSSVVVSVVS